MSSNGVPIQDIADTVGHKSTHVTQTVYRHVIVPAIQGGATAQQPGPNRQCDGQLDCDDGQDRGHGRQRNQARMNHDEKYDHERGYRGGHSAQR
jgi:hypothetical protein